MLRGKQPDIRHIYRFGCVAYRRIPYGKQCTEKFSSKGQRCILLSCSRGCWELLNVETGKFYRSSDIEATESVMFRHRYPLNYFKEKGFPKFDLVYTDRHGDEEIDFREGIPENYGKESSSVAKLTSGVKRLNLHDSEISSKRKKLNADELIDENIKLEINEHRVLLSGNRVEKNVALEKKYFSMMCELNENPKSYKEAMNSKDRDKWIAAINSELDSQYKNKTWVIVDRPKNEKVIDSRWVMVIKPEADESKRYKARLVSRGFKDEHMYKFSEIYAPVVGISDVRILFAIANKLKWDIVQMDVDMAFLNSELDVDKPVYMEIPEGVDVDRKYREKKVCKLVKALYELKVSPKRWYLKFRETMVQMGFTVFDGQVCMFYWRKRGTFAIVMLYVDDILVTGIDVNVTGNNRDKIIEIKMKLCEIYKMKVLGVSSIQRALQLTLFSADKMKIVVNMDGHVLFFDQSDSVKLSFCSSTCPPHSLLL